MMQPSRQQYTPNLFEQKKTEKNDILRPFIS